MSANRPSGQEEEACSTPQASAGSRGIGIKALVAAIVATSCCTVPLLLIAVVGFGSGTLSGAGTFLPRYAPWAGGLLMLAFLALEVRRRGGGSFSLDGVRRARPAIVGGLAVFALAWLGMRVVVAPLLAQTAVSIRVSLSGGGSPVVIPGPQRPLQLEIKGMYCPACVATEQAALSSLKGVSKVDVWIGGAKLVYNPRVVTAERIRRAATFYVYKATIAKDGGRSGA
jgi:mercuric ion transport protein